MEAIKRLLIAGRLNAELKEYFIASGCKFEYLLKESAAVTDSDLDWADAYLSFNRPPKADLGNVKWVHALGAGVDSYLFQKHWPAKTILTRTEGDFGNKIGQHCLARALAHCQNMQKYFYDKSERSWKGEESQLLTKKKIIIIGAGLIGKTIASYFNFFQCEVDGVTRRGQIKGGFREVFPFAKLPEIIGNYDFVILCTPLTDATYKFIDRDLLSRCSNSYLINIARGAEIDNGALLEALDKNWLSGAALDVFDEEPLPKTSEFWNHKKITFSPHVAALTTAEEAGESFLKCLYSFQEGKIPYLQVDIEKGY